MSGYQQPLNPLGFIGDGRLEECIVLTHVVGRELQKRWVDESHEVRFSPRIELDTSRRPFLFLGVSLNKYGNGSSSPDYEKTDIIQMGLKDSQALYRLATLMGIEMYLNEERMFSIEPSFGVVEFVEYPFDREKLEYTGACKTLPTRGHEFGAETDSFIRSLESDNVHCEAVLARLSETLGSAIIEEFRTYLRSK